MALFSGSGSLEMSGGDIRIYDVEFGNGTTHCLGFTATRGYINHCQFTSAGVCVEVNGEEINITDSHFDGFETAILSDGSNILNVSGCWISSGTTGIEGFVDDGSIIRDNWFRNLDVAIEFDQAADWTVISGNTMVVSTGIHISSPIACLIDGNVILPDEDGIVLDDAAGTGRGDADTRVSNNMIYQPSMGSVNTYDGIRLDSVVNVSVQGNHIVPGSSAPRYGINVASGTNNVVFANFLGDASAYGTGDFNDAGTATLTAPGANGQFSY